MNKSVFFLFGVLIATSIVSCNTDEVKVKGTVMFGSNYAIINCISTVNIFIDGRHIGIIDFPVDSVPNCDLNYGFREELAVGHHNYKVEIRPPQGNGCTADVFGELDITERGCETVFINYREIEWN